MQADYTFDNMNNGLIRTHKSSINRALNSQHLLERFGVAFQVCVWLSNFVHKHLIILHQESTQEKLVLKT